MAQTDRPTDSAPETTPAADAASPTISDKDKKTAQAWFERAQKVADSRNYDYAIECYINGLRAWPEAVEEGHKRLFAVGMARRAAGLKKAGILEALKRSKNARDPLQSMLNAEFLMAKDPGNSAHMEAMLKNANKAHLDSTICWLGPLFLDTMAREKKPRASRLKVAQEVFQECGTRAEAASDFQTALEAYECGLTAMEYLHQLKPNDLEIANALRDTSGRLTIVKGHYDKGQNFRDSIQDADGQKRIHDEDRLVQAEDRQEELVAKAREDLDADPDNPTRIAHLADMLCRTQQPEHETQAIDTLTDAYKRLKNYRFKVRADDIRVRQYRRQARALISKSRTEPENTDLKRKAAALNQEMQAFELTIAKERVDNYPTDLKLRYEYGVRLYRTGRYDDALPILQSAQTDPRHRDQCKAFIGRCFVAKGYAGQAIEVLNDAIEHRDVKNDDLGKELHYWLGLAYEKDGKIDDALKMFGQIIQWDYNYQDVRKRMDALRNKSQ